MGRGIAVTFAMAGHWVHLIDIKKRTPEAFDSLRVSATDEIRTTLQTLQEVGVIDAARKEGAWRRISLFAQPDSAQALTDADVIFEAVPETLEAKESTLNWVSRVARPESIVASTTSTMLTDELQTFVSPPGRFLNAHWLNPAYIVPLVEVSPGRDTDPATIQRLTTLLELIGKVPVVCKASPGYIVPRIQALAMNEAARLVEEGVATVEDIDKASKYGFGFRFAVLGLLEFIDWGGGDILYYASRYMTEAMDDDRYASPPIIERHMDEGHIGLRTLQGFLDYSSMDVNAYQRERLQAFVGMLQHIGKLPAYDDTVFDNADADADTDVDDAQQHAVVTVKRYLSAMESRDLLTAQGFLADNFCMTFPGGVTFTTLQQLVEWSKTRYQSVAKTYEGFDQTTSGSEVIVYCHGMLNGVWLDGQSFSGIRFIDRFVIVDGLIRSQLVWNDLAEYRAGTVVK